MNTNTIQNFTFAQNHIVMTVTLDGEPWFKANDVASALQYSNIREGLSKHVDAEDRQTFNLKNLHIDQSSVTNRDGTSAPILSPLGGNPNITFINESGLYALIFGSKLPAAKSFKRWVTSEVLPALRRTGTYTMPQAASVQTAVCPCSGTEYREELYTMRCSLMDMRSCKSEHKARSQGTTAALKMVTLLLSRADTDEVLKDWLAFINNVQLMGNIRRSIRAAFLHSFLAVFRASLKEQEHGCALSEQIAAVWEEYKDKERDPHTQRADLVTAARSLRQILDLA